MLRKTIVTLLAIVVITVMSLSGALARGGFGGRRERRRHGRLPRWRWRLRWVPWRRVRRAWHRHRCRRRPRHWRWRLAWWRLCAAAGGVVAVAALVSPLPDWSGSGSGYGFGLSLLWRLLPLLLRRRLLLRVPHDDDAVGMAPPSRAAVLLTDPKRSHVLKRSLFAKAALFLEAALFTPALSVSAVHETECCSCRPARCRRYRQSLPNRCR